MPDNWFGGLALSGIAVGLLAAFWRQLKGGAVRLTRLLVCRVEIDCNHLSSVVSRRLLAEGRLLSIGGRVIRSVNATFKATGRLMRVPVDAPNPEPRVVWYGRGPVLLATVTQSTGTVTVQHSQEKLSVTYLRGTLNIDRLLFEAAEELNGSGRTSTFGAGYRVIHHDGSVGVPSQGFRGAQSEPMAVDSGETSLYAAGGGLNPSPVGYTRDMFGEPCPLDPFACYVAGPAVEAMTKDCERWLRSREFCNARGLSWRRGWLLHGAPGGGKSTAVRLIAQKFSLPVHTFALGTMRPQEFRRAWEQCQYQSPSVAVWEDLDAVFCQRENVTGEEGGLTFDVVLNAISGVKSSDGVLLVVTTNDLDSIDHALGRPLNEAVVSTTSRPGRLDVAFRFDHPTDHDRRQLAQKMLGRLLTGEEVEQEVEATKGFSMSATHQKFIDRALSVYWSRADDPSVVTVT